MTSLLPLVLGLALLLALLSAAARRLGVASSILMLLAGAALSFAPGLPPVALDPDLVLLGLLPPLLYAAGVGMSWQGFRANLRPILLLAVGCVLATATAVAAVAHWALGLPWAVGFVLGAIVSPPDAVAPMAVLRGLRLPGRLVTVIEGESLVNDATALVLLNFALAAVDTGEPRLLAAAGRFLLIVGGEAAFGVAVGWAMLRLRHLVAEPRAEVLLALATPFLAFWPPHEAGGSGVVACVAAGLWVSWNGRRLIRPPTRLQGFFVWGLVTWSVEALVFLLTGLQARAVLESLDGGWGRALGGALAVVATMVVARVAWVFPATYLPRLLSPALRARDPAPGWRLPALLAVAGLRGVVSLAAALSLPASVPGRDLVLFVTFAAIAATLVGLGAVLPAVARALGLDRLGAEEARRHKREERQARLGGLSAVLHALDRAEAEGANAGAVTALRRRHGDRREQLEVTADEDTPGDPVAEDGALQLTLVAVEREAIERAFEEGRLTDEARRRAEREVDLEEARVRHALASAGDGGDPAD